MNDLNPMQLEAIRYQQGPLLILAGAGSGKTKVITEKLAYLMNNQVCLSTQILAVTFTRKAAREMQERAQHTLKLKGKGKQRAPQISTFHTFGLNFLKQEYKSIQFKSNISILDAEDTLLLLQDLLCAQSDTSKEALVIYLKHISLWKTQGLKPEEALALAKTSFEANAAKVYAEYQKKLKIYNAVDFDDLILLPVQILKEIPEVREKWQNKIRYILVDEYQDTNASQYQLLRLLSGPLGNFTVVGDDHQSIYTFRGAKPDNLLELQQDYPYLKVIKLEQNYRSTGTILKAANHLIQFNTNLFTKNLWSAFGMGEPITIFSAQDEEQEAEQVVSEILSHKLQQGTHFKDYAILYRSNHQAKIFEKLLRMHQMPYQLSGGISFFSRTEVKDILAYFKIMVNPDDDSAFLRIVNTPKREIGPATVEKLSYYAQKREISLFEASLEIGLEQYLPEQATQRLRNFVTWLVNTSDNAQRGDTFAVIRDLIKTIHYENWLLENSHSLKSFDRKWANVNELLQWVERLLNPKEDKPKTLEEVVHTLILSDILEHTNQEKNSDCIQLMTLHAAKGLEFPYVYLIGLAEETLPHRTSIEQDTIEEERRLMYVGITRAKKELHLSYAKTRKRFNDLTVTVPSRFISELPEETLQWKNSEVTPEKAQAQGKKHLDLIRSLLLND